MCACVYAFMNIYVRKCRCFWRPEVSKKYLELDEQLVVSPFWVLGTELGSAAVGRLWALVTSEPLVTILIMCAHVYIHGPLSFLGP